MNNNKTDKKIAKMMKPVTKANWKELEKISAAFESYIEERKFEPTLKELLRQCYILIREYKHETKRRHADEYRETILKLFGQGYPSLASILFSTSYSSLKPLSEKLIVDVIPTVKDAGIWIRDSDINKKALQKTIIRDPAHYYDSILFDWACKTSPVALLLPLFQILLSNRDRQNHQEDSDRLLEKLLMRDKNGALSSEILMTIHNSSQMMRRLLEAVSRLPITWRSWCVGIAHYLTDKDSSQKSQELLLVIEDYLSSSPGKATQFAKFFLAHLLTTMSITKRYLAEDDKKDLVEIRDRLIKLILVQPYDTKEEAWIAGPIAVITASLMEGKAAISLHAAKQMSQGLRALESNPDSAEVFRAVAMNLGLTQISDKGEVTSFDPGIHQDIEGGVIPGDSVKVKLCGWSFEGKVVIRAHVARNSGA